MTLYTFKVLFIKAFIQKNLPSTHYGKYYTRLPYKNETGSSYQNSLGYWERDPRLSVS